MSRFAEHRRPVILLRVSFGTEHPPSAPADPEDAGARSSSRARFGWPSRDHDADTGLLYNVARYYEPALGQWTTVDPIGCSAADVSLYRYAGNAPSP